MCFIFIFMVRLLMIWRENLLEIGQIQGDGFYVVIIIEICVCIEFIKYMYKWLMIRQIKISLLIEIEGGFVKIVFMFFF